MRRARLEGRHSGWKALVLVAHHRRPGMQVAPAAELGAAQDAAYRSRAGTGPAGDLVAGKVLLAQRQPLFNN